MKVNERAVKELGTKVDPARDLVTVDGRLVSRPETKSYYLLYKPSGCVTTASDPEGRPTALEYLRGVKGRVFSVGRLDYDAEGAVVFTDDGELANRLAHPRFGHRRTYLVKVRGEPPAAALERMVAGVRLEDGPARALEVAVHERAERNVWIRVVVAEGRFHLVKRLCEAVGLFVQRLFRPEFGGVTVEGLRPGQFRPLTPVELRAMKSSVGLGGTALYSDDGGASFEPAPAIAGVDFHAIHERYVAGSDGAIRSWAYGPDVLGETPSIIGDDPHPLFGITEADSYDFEFPEVVVAVGADGYVVERRLYREEWYCAGG